MKQILSYGILSCVISISSAYAASIRIHWQNDRVFSDYDRNPLSIGLPANGDGALLELGYYTLATAASPFDGDWVVLDSATMGDENINEPGHFDVVSSFIGAVPMSPGVGTPLAIRFYDSTSLSSSNYFNAVSNTDGSWNWVEPADPEVVLSLSVFKSISTIVYEMDGDAARITYKPIPEPSAILLAGCALAFAMGRQRRRGM